MTLYRSYLERCLVSSSVSPALGSVAAQNFALGSQILAEDAQIGDLTSEGADGLDSSTDIVLGDLNPVFKIRDTSFAIEISLGLELVISLLL